MIADELEKLNTMKADGTISEDEYERAKDKLLGKKACTVSDSLGMEPNSFCLLLHLSQFAGFVVPGAGFVTPIILWAVGKDKSEEVDWHGRMVMNWMLSMLIYAVVTIILCFLLIGFLLIPVLFVFQIVFPIIGAVKANSGERWKYPLTIPFLGIS